MNEQKRTEWDESYKRGDNLLLYPQTVVIQFLNRHVVKRISATEKVVRLPDAPADRKIRCLDFACGAGIHTTLCDDFDIEAYGIDISTQGIKIAKENAILLGKHATAKRFSVITSEDQSLPFADNFFDVTIAESCLDSMSFDFACRYMKEIKRVTRCKIYFSCISSQITGEEVGDVVVSKAHEHGTIQAYFNKDRILELSGASLQDFSMMEEVVQHDVLCGGVVNARFHCVLELEK